MKMEKMDIRKKEDMINIRSAVWNGRDYFLISTEEKSLERLEPQLIYYNDNFVGMLEQGLMDPYYQLFIKNDVSVKETVNILLDVTKKLFYDYKIPVLGIKTGELNKHDEIFTQELYKCYQNVADKRRKQYERKKRINELHELQNLADRRKLLNEVAKTYTLNIKRKGE